MRHKVAMPLINYFRRRATAVEPITTSGVPQDRRRKPRKRAAPGTTVLIIDDSRTMVAALGSMLRENRFTILEAYDGEAGLEVLRKIKPDLIFLDILLPGMTGFDVLRRIRRSTYVGKVPVIVMSGHAAAAQEYHVRRIGADDFLRKPCSRAEVFSRVERLLDLKPNALSAVAGDGAEMLPLDRE